MGIIASMAYDEELDDDLVAIDAGHLFGNSITKVGFRRGTFLRGFMYDFVERFAPHLKREFIDDAFSCHSKAELDELFSNLTLPSH